MDDIGELRIAEASSIANEAAEIAAARAADEYRVIAIDELMAHTWRYEGQRVTVTGRLMDIEQTFDGKEYALLDIAIPGDLAHTGDAAIEWDGDKSRLRPGQTMTVWGAVVGTHISGGRACGFTVSPAIRADRLEAQ
ncbi:MAG: hypothetical protein NTZ05_13855 [Chloroflexi bacterium]|nr:hypothetical protein [Chloroflexota bacterium]